MTEGAPESPFRGGFRFEPETGDHAGACTVEAWGATVRELLPRVLEAASNAAGGVGERSGQRTFEVRARSLLTIVESLVAIGLTTPLAAAVCDAAPSDDSWHGEETVELRIATSPPGPDRLVLAYTPGSARVWRENLLLRARFHVRPR